MRFRYLVEKLGASGALEEIEGRIGYNWRVSLNRRLRQSRSKALSDGFHSASPDAGP